ncbi:MAG: glycosyltransferase [Candidatus Microthrix sp.]|nr:glycosyltransferase [Candidatus Microthrix sp.]MBK6502712.1 glycosyltransferase [Candidatus Microthrix sp.]
MTSATSPTNPPPLDAPPLLSVITPTYNEAGNILVLLENLERALAEVTYEIIVVDDDSPDGTWQLAEDHAAAHHAGASASKISRQGPVARRPCRNGVGRGPNVGGDRRRRAAR